MTAKQLPSQLGLTSEMNMHIEEVDDYFENDLWSFNQASGCISSAL